MNIAISRPYDDDTIVEVYIIDHPTKGPKDFEEDWDRFRKDIVDANPDTWCVDEVIEKLQGIGWTVQTTDPARVTY